MILIVLGDRFGHHIGVHDDAAIDVARGPAAGLDQGGFAPQKSFFVGIENAHEGHFGKIESFA